MKTQAYPLLFEPVYQPYVWGGCRIPTLFGRAPRSGVCAESWEIADRPEGMSVVRNGPLAGATLHELMVAMREKLAGAAATGPVFPVLVKIIDARERLSLQVHPDEASAARLAGEAKTEMWYVLHADPDAQVLVGLLPGVDERSFRQALEERRLEQVLRRIPVRAGEAIFVPGGRVHAIDRGSVLLEVQQNSNTTYRVSDWDRLDENGRARAVHLAEALQAIRWHDTADPAITPRRLPAQADNPRWEVLRCAHFTMLRIEQRHPQTVVNNGRSFHAVFVAEGAVGIAGGGMRASLGPGTSCLLPAALERYALEPRGGPATLLRISLP
jgi:mannose-6-phosphate isomerase